MAIGLTKVPKISIRSRNHSPSSQSDQSTFDLPSKGDGKNCNFTGKENGTKKLDSYRDNESEAGNKIMVVVDPSIEARGALEWTLSHTLQKHDTLVLLHVLKPCKSDVSGKQNLEAYELLRSMKNMCQNIRPGVTIVLEMQEGKEKGHVIVEAAEQHNVQLLVLGQRKQTVFWRWLKRLMGKRRKCGGVVKYCIQKAKCMTIAVRRKGRKSGGYLITTKRHKKFWLLA